MVSRPMTHAEILDAINNVLGTTLSTAWTDAKLSLLLEDAVTEVSEAVPFIMRDIYQIETRTGIATETSSNNLVDDTKSQFLTTDTEKVIYNSTDKTWAVVESRTNAYTVVLSADIMASGDNYEMYNKACWSRKQINIEDSSDYLWIIGAVYPVEPSLWQTPMRNMRNVIEHRRDIIELDAVSLDDTGQATANKDVHIYFARQHKLNSMGTLAGDVNKTGGYSAGATTMTVHALGSTEIIPKDMLFTVALASGIESRLTYRMTADDTTNGNEADLVFFPGLEADVADEAAVTFIGSTLTPELERIIVQIVVGESIMAEALQQINQIPKGGATVDRDYYSMGERTAEKARTKLRSMVDVDLRANKSYSRG